jgi:hypothetical protein
MYLYQLSRYCTPGDRCPEMGRGKCGWGLKVVGFLSETGSIADEMGNALYKKKVMI